MNRDMRRFLRKGRRLDRPTDRHWQTLPIKIRYTDMERPLTEDLKDKPIELAFDVDTDSEFILNLSVAECVALIDVIKIRCDEYQKGLAKGPRKGGPLVLRS